MKNIPKRIWLNTGLDKNEDVKDFKELSEVTWCEDKTSNGDIPYKRVHRVNKYVLCSWILAIITVPLAYLIYIPCTLFKTICDMDEFADFYQSVMGYLLIPLKEYLRWKNKITNKF